MPQSLTSDVWERLRRGQLPLSIDPLRRWLVRGHMGGGLGGRAPRAAVSWTVGFTPLAQDYVVEAYADYEATRGGLGAEFLAEVGRVAGLISAFPEAYPEVHRGVRRALVRRAPTSVRPNEVLRLTEPRDAPYRRHGSNPAAPAAEHAR